MQDNIYKRLSKIEAMTNVKKAKLNETLLAAYEAACADKNEDEAAALVRKLRNKLLAKSDAQMSIDRMGLTAPTGSTFTAWLSFLRGMAGALNGEWAQYRQALRDIPQQDGFPFDIKFPQEPQN